MNWNELKKPMSTVALMVLIMAGPWLHHDKVICIQSDSHIQVERLGADCCRQEVTASASGAIIVSDSDLDCGSCRDLQFAREATRTPQCQSSVLALHKSNCLILAGSVSSYGCAGALPSRQPIPLYPLGKRSLPYITLSIVSRC